MNVVTEFENKLAEVLGVDDVIAVNSGTSALIATLYSMDLDFTDEVITSPFTFQATVNAILIAGGVPRFCDIISEIAPVMSSFALRPLITTCTKVLLPVHLFGKVCDVDYWLSQYKNLYIIEDACQAFLANGYNGKLAGTMGDAGCFSFYKSKNLSTFEGGAIAIPAHSRLDREKIRAITNQGQVGRFNHEYVGFNFRMSEPCALIGLRQLENHRLGIESEIGKYGTKDGYYPKVAYHQPALIRRGLTGNCPIAEALAKKVSQCSSY